MQTEKQRNIFYILATIPSIYCFISYITVAIWIIVSILKKDFTITAEGTLLWWIAYVAVILGIIQLPFYVIWATISNNIPVKEKARWIFLIIFGNLITMPVFLFKKYRKKF